MVDNILEMRGITKTFPGVRALDDVSISVRRGSIHAICGENGAGKSTLMKVLSGVYPAGTFDGEILVDGEAQSFRSISDSEAQGIVIIHQELALSPFLSIAENIFLGNERERLGWIDWNRTNYEAAQLLIKVGLLDNPITRITELGVGKQQLVEIAKALSKKVRLLILDEPTAALNDADSAHLLGLLEQLKSEGVTCILISHKLNEIEAVADDVTIIRDGRTIETLDVSSGSVSEPRIIRGMVGRDLEHRFPPHTPVIGDEVLRVADWTVHHPIDHERVVVDHADLTVRAGEIVGLAGLMGAGRTELAMSIFGHSYGSGISGQLFIHGKPVTARTVPAAIRAGMAYATEDRKRYGLNLIEGVRRNVSAAALSSLARLGWVNDYEEVVVAERYRRDLNIKSPGIETIVGRLSGGTQQEVVRSQWMFADPDVLILDEPTRGIDVGAKYEIYNIINRLADEGKAVLVISSELAELIGMCDRIYTISAGRVTGDVARADADPEHLLRLMTLERERDHR